MFLIFGCKDLIFTSIYGLSWYLYDCLSFYFVFLKKEYIFVVGCCVASIIFDCLALYDTSCKSG